MGPCLAHRVPSARGYSLAPCAALVADAVAKQSMWRCQPRKQITVPLPVYALLRLAHAQAEALKSFPSRTANRSSTCVITEAAASPNTSERERAHQQVQGRRSQQRYHGRSNRS